MDNQTLDQQAIDLAKAIRQSESSGDFNAKGASGETGAYQFTPETWKSYASKYGINVPIEQATPQQQNAVAYNKIKEWKDKGYNVGQIASMWNAGEGEPDAYTGKFSNGASSKGVNKAGVKFNVPDYVASVAKAYQTLKTGGQVSTDVNNPSSIAGTQMGEQPQQTQQGYKPTFQTNANEGYVETAAKTLGNIPSSAINFTKGVASSLDPRNTAKIVSQIPGEFSGLVKESGGVGKAITSTIKELPKSIYESLTPQWIKKLIGGDTEGSMKTITEDPVGQIAPLIFAAKGIAEKAGVGAQFDKAMSDVSGTVTKPISALASKVGETASKTAKFITGQEFNVKPSTIEETIKNPKVFTKENIQNADDARMALGEQIKTSLDERISQKSETGLEYNSIKSNTTPIKVDPNFLLDQIQKETGLVLDKKGQFQGTTISKIDSQADINKIQQFYDKTQPLFDKGEMLPEEFLTMRDRLGKIAFNEGGIGKSTPLANMDKGIRANLNAEYRPQIEGLEELDADFSSQLKELQDLKKGILDKNGQLTAGAVNKIATATGRGKVDLLNKLETITPGITKQIGIVQALEDWKNSSQGFKIGNFGKGATIAGSYMGGGPMGALIATLLTSPEVAVPMLRFFGTTNNIASLTINSIINKLNSAIALSPAELKIFIGAMSTNKSNFPVSAFAPIPVDNQNKEQIASEIQQDPEEPSYTISESDLSITAPNGKVYTFKNKEALDAFRQEAGL